MHAEAKRLYERALRIWEKALGPDNLVVAHPLTGLATVALAQGRPDEALPLIERALRIRESSDAAPSSIAESRFVLARALWEALGEGRDRERALAAAVEAVEGYRAADEGSAKELLEIEAWIAEHEGALQPPRGSEYPASRRNSQLELRNR